MRMRKSCRFATTSLVFLATFSTLAASSKTQAHMTLRAGGTGSARAAFLEYGNTYTKKHPDIHFEWIPGMGPVGAFKATSAKATELAFTSTLPESIGISPEISAKLSHHYLGKTALVFAVHHDVPVTNVSKADLLKLFSGELKSWSNGIPVRLILRQPADSDTLIAERNFPELEQAMNAARKREGMTTVLSSEDSHQRISETSGALGFSTLSQMRDSDDALKSLSYEHKSATLTTLNDGTYPLLKKLYVFQQKEATPEVRAFIDFVLSHEGQSIRNKHGYSLNE